MKALPLVLLLSLPLCLAAAEVQLGDTFSDVRTALGAPRGQVRAGDRLLLYYERGEVQLQAGAVSRVALLSSADFAALQTRRAAEAVRLREENEIRTARLGAEGEALKARKLADPSFQAAPVAYQVAFWEDFSRRYPGVSSSEQLAIARMRLNEQLEEKRRLALQEERLAELEARVIAAEARTAEARYTDYYPVRYRSASYGRTYQSSYGQSANGLSPAEYHFANAQYPSVISTLRPNNPSVLSTLRPVNPSVLSTLRPTVQTGLRGSDNRQVADSNCDEDGRDSRSRDRGYDRGMRHGNGRY